MLSNKSDVSGEVSDKFYSPISRYGYLTPAQRKKLREKRNLNFSPLKEITDRKPTKTKSSIRKSKHKVHSKSKLKIQTKELIYKKIIKPNLPEIRCTAAQLITTKKNDIVTKKFFKTRSPEHFKKANYVVPLVYKPKRLDFSSAKLSEKSYFLPDSDHPLNELCESGTDLDFSKTVEKPFIVYVYPVLEGDERSCDILPSDSDKNEKLLFDNQQSFMENSNLPELVSEIDCSEKPTDSDSFEKSNGSDFCEKLNGSIGEDSEMDSSTSNLKKKTNQKLYPIFYKQTPKKTEPVRKSITGKKTFSVKDTSKGYEQMIIDAGQKQIGAKQCKTCNMIYFIGQEEDEKLHSNYHDMYMANLRFPGWKKEDVVRNYEDGRVIKVTKDDYKKLKKVQDILLIANRDLGFPSNELPERPDLTFLLFISNDKKVKGCLVAESITSASPVVLDETSDVKSKKEDEKIWYASSETVPAVCGINRIWVAKVYRRQKVASRLIDCLRCCFIYGHVVSLQEIAFTDPSPDGRIFASHYTGTDNFLVYK